jgi:hypothetical protein
MIKVSPVFEKKKRHVNQIYSSQLTMFNIILVGRIKYCDKRLKNKEKMTPETIILLLCLLVAIGMGLSNRCLATILGDI